ncbi:MAG: F0F1 ATP synthase subunit B [Clostridia bacterium]|nr:F0F1 ATP synthase subunit B [Clostridia bacterium]MBR6780510.1 F0F1 ATP synthase subunit B [Clostridia bacterium]
MSEYLELISIQWPEIVVTIANLLILFLLVKKFLFKPVQKILAQRQEQVDTMYADAQAAKTAAEQDKATYSAKLADAQQEADEILRVAHQRATQAGDIVVRDAMSKASSIKRKAEAEIARERKKAVNEIKDEISEISVDIAEQVLGREISEQDHRQLVDSFIDTIGE